MSGAGRLIVLEGAEGVGKTTQARRLVGRLCDAGEDAVATREPGGTWLGERVRDLLLHAEVEITPRAELLLFLAARAQVVDDVRLHLAAAKSVVLDRFFLSTYAYQIAGRGLPEVAVRQLNTFATGGLKPDLTIVLALAPDEGLARVTARTQRGERDRIERSGIDFHERVAAAFAMFLTKDWQREHPECGRIVGVDARGSEDAVAARIWAAVAAAEE